MKTEWRIFIISLFQNDACGIDISDYLKFEEVLQNSNYSHIFIVFLRVYLRQLLCRTGLDMGCTKETWREKNADGNNNHRSPRQIKTYCISHYPVKLSRELSGARLGDNQFLNKKHSWFLPREYGGSAPKIISRYLIHWSQMKSKPVWVCGSLNAHIKLHMLLCER